MPVFSPPLTWLGQSLEPCEGWFVFVCVFYAGTTVSTRSHPLTTELDQTRRWSEIKGSKDWGKTKVLCHHACLLPRQ